MLNFGHKRSKLWMLMNALINFLYLLIIFKNDIIFSVKPTDTNCPNHETILLRKWLLMKTYTTIILLIKFKWLVMFKRMSYILPKKKKNLL